MMWQVQLSIKAPRSEQIVHSISVMVKLSEKFTNPELS